MTACARREHLRDTLRQPAAGRAPAWAPSAGAEQPDERWWAPPSYPLYAHCPRPGEPVSVKLWAIELSMERADGTVSAPGLSIERVRAVKEALDRIAAGETRGMVAAVCPRPARTAHDTLIDVLDPACAVEIVCPALADGAIACQTQHIGYAGLGLTERLQRVGPARWRRDLPLAFDRDQPDWPRGLGQTATVHTTDGQWLRGQVGWVGSSAGSQRGRIYVAGRLLTREQVISITPAEEH